MEKFNRKVKFNLTPKYNLYNRELEVAYLYYEEVEKNPKSNIKTVGWLISKKDIPSNYKLACYIELNYNIYAIYISTRTKRIIVMNCEYNGEIGNGIIFK